MADFGNRNQWRFMFMMIAGVPAFVAFIVGVIIGWWLL